MFLRMKLLCPPVFRFKNQFRIRYWKSWNPGDLQGRGERFLPIVRLNFSSPSMLNAFQYISVCFLSGWLTRHFQSFDAQKYFILHSLSLRKRSFSANSLTGYTSRILTHGTENRRFEMARTLFSYNTVPNPNTLSSPYPPAYNFHCLNLNNFL